MKRKRIETKIIYLSDNINDILEDVLTDINNQYDGYDCNLNTKIKKDTYIGIYVTK